MAYLGAHALTQTHMRTHTWTCTLEALITVTKRHYSVNAWQRCRAAEELRRGEAQAVEMCQRGTGEAAAAACKRATISAVVMKLAYLTSTCHNRRLRDKNTWMHLLWSPIRWYHLTLGGHIHKRTNKCLCAQTSKYVHTHACMCDTFVWRSCERVSCDGVRQQMLVAMMQLAGCYRAAQLLSSASQPVS